MTDTAKLLRTIGIVLAVFAVLQLLFGAVCAYMIAGIDDNVWRGLRLNDLMETAFVVGLGTAFVGAVAFLFGQYGLRIRQWWFAKWCGWRGHRFTEWRQVTRVVRGEVRHCQRKGCPVMEWRPDAEFRVAMNRCLAGIAKAGMTFNEFAQKMGKQGRYGAH